jgi:hypothetical protein
MISHKAQTEVCSISTSIPIQPRIPACVVMTVYDVVVYAIIILSYTVPYCLAISSSDFVDLSFTCPVYAVCPQICAPTIEECPTRCQNNETLCVNNDSCTPDDGNGSSCSLIFLGQPYDNSPCTTPCAPVACAAVIATVPSCFENFAMFYDLVENCQTHNDSNSSTTGEDNDKPDLLWTNSINVFVGIWGMLGTITIVAWCWYK